MNCCDTAAFWGRALSAWTLNSHNSRVEFTLILEGGHHCEPGGPDKMMNIAFFG
jgi:hypothetical protein